MHSPAPVKQQVVERAKALAPTFAARADASEAARTIPKQSVHSASLTDFAAGGNFFRSAASASI